MPKQNDIFPQSAEELQKEAQSIRERHEEEQEQAEIILHEFLTSAKELKKICEAHDKCNSQCPLYDKEAQWCQVSPSRTLIDTDALDPWQWEFDD